MLYMVPPPKEDGSSHKRSTSALGLRKSHYATYHISPSRRLWRLPGPPPCAHGPRHRMARRAAHSTDHPHPRDRRARATPAAAGPGPGRTPVSFDEIAPRASAAFVLTPVS